MKSISDIIQSTEEKSYDVFIDVFAGSSAMFSFSFERYSLSTVEISLMTPFPHCDCTNHSNECVNCTKELVQEFGITNFLIPGEAKVRKMYCDSSIERNIATLPTFILYFSHTSSYFSIVVEALNLVYKSKSETKKKILS